MSTIPAFAAVHEPGQSAPSATEKIKDFLDRHPMIDQLLLEAEAPLRTAFGGEVTITLTVETDPEVLGWEYLVVGIQTARPAEEAHTRLRAFDDAWWLSQTPRAQDKLVFDLAEAV